MLGFIKKLQNKTRSYNTAQVHVQGGLAITPSQMSQLAEAGRPISAQMLGAENFYDGDTSPIGEVPFLYRRGIDASDIYDYQQRSRQKIKNYVNSIEAQN